MTVEVTLAERILVVDDLPANVRMLTGMLKPRGYDVISASGGRDGLDKVRSANPDLVLLDVMMPDINGYDVCRAIRNDETTRMLPVVMVTALDDAQERVKGIEAGADDFLAKPVTQPELLARVRSLLRIKAYHDTVQRQAAEISASNQTLERLLGEIREKSRKLEQELGAARELQLGMLPRKFPECTPSRPVEVHALMQPARVVGGDLYDFFYDREGRFWFLVGDVSGKGAQAAMFMARARSLVRMAAHLWHSLEPVSLTPGALAATVNRELCQDNRERMFVSLFVGMLDVSSGKLSYVNAGHPPPYLLGKEAPKALRCPPSAPLGVTLKADYPTHEIYIASGDSLFVCTDGVGEASEVSGQLFGQSRLESALQSAGALTAAELVASIHRSVTEFGIGAEPADDLTMLAVRWLPQTAAIASGSPLP